MAWEFSFLDYLQTWHNPILDKIMFAITSLGNAGILWIAVGLVLLIPKKYRRLGFQTLAAMMLTFIVGNLILKNAFHRWRPCWGEEAFVIKAGIDTLGINPMEYSFPSGHSMNGITAAVTLLLNEKKFGIPALILALLICFSRLYIYVHFPTDVLGGIAIGICSAIIMNYIFKKKGWKTVNDLR